MLLRDTRAFPGGGGRAAGALMKQMEIAVTLEVILQLKDMLEVMDNLEEVIPAVVVAVLQKLVILMVLDTEETVLAIV